MPLFLVKRELPGVTREDLDAAAYRAIACLLDHEGMKWLTSYWDEKAGRLHCVYEASSSKEVEDHARRSRIPCDEVWPVTRFNPEMWQWYPGEGTAPESA